MAGGCRNLHSHVVSAYAARGRGNEKSGEACDRQVNDRLPGVHCFEKGAGPLFIAISGTRAFP
jgi:hypothetical protein